MYDNTREYFEDITKYLECFKSEMNKVHRDIEYYIYAYTDSAFTVAITTNDGYEITMEGEYNMILSCIDGLIESEVNR